MTTVGCQAGGRCTSVTFEIWVMGKLQPPPPDDTQPSGRTLLGQLLINPRSSRPHEAAADTWPLLAHRGKVISPGTLKRFAISKRHWMTRICPCTLWCTSVGVQLHQLMSSLHSQNAWLLLHVWLFPKITLIPDLHFDQIPRQNVWRARPLPRHDITAIFFSLSNTGCSPHTHTHTRSMALSHTHTHTNVTCHVTRFRHEILVY